MAEKTSSVLDKFNLGFWKSEKKTEEEINKELEDLQAKHEKELQAFYDLNKKWKKDEVDAYNHICKIIDSKSNDEKSMFCYVLISEMKKLELENFLLKKQVATTIVVESDK